MKLNELRKSINSASQAAKVEKLEPEIFPCLRIVHNAVEIYSLKLKEISGLNDSQLSFMLYEKILPGGEKLNHNGE